DHLSPPLASSYLCHKCGRQFSIDDNSGGGCTHTGTWHAKVSDCSYLICGINLGKQLSIGKQHWSCCYSLDRNSNICTQSKPHSFIK
ncbi:unnamed protein product, partial [Didymodactylos carnosus]